MANCDEFIFYDDLAKVESEKSKRKSRRKSNRKKAGKDSKTPEDAAAQEQEDRTQEAIDLVVQTIEDLFRERDAEEKVWGSMVKQTLKRRRPGFDETAYGFRSFSALLEEAQKRKQLKLSHDEKSGGYIILDYNPD